MSVRHTVTYVCDGCGCDAESRAGGALQIEHFTRHDDVEGTLHLCATCCGAAKIALSSGANSCSLSPRLLRVLVSEAVRMAVGA